MEINMGGEKSSSISYDENAENFNNEIFFVDNLGRFLTMKFNNKTYDILKYIALIALPAIQVFWLTIGKIWNLEYTVEIGATIGAVALLLGTLLGVSNKNFKQMIDDIEEADRLADEEIEESEVE